MKKNMIKKIPLVVLLSLSIFPQNIFAIVDYSETSEAPKASVNKSQTSAGGAKESKSPLIWKSDISLDANYEILNVGSNKIGLTNIGTHIQTPFNVYFDASFWHAKDNNTQSSGNPKLILGFNWLRFGSPADMAAINFYGGARLKSNSVLGSSRNDKIFGAETTKKFGSFGLGLGYDLTMTGTPNKAADTAIGNIHRIEVSAGWMATNDIQFEVSAENFRVQASSNTSRANYLAKDISFSTITPKLNLQIFPTVNFELGARFQMQKPKTDQNILTMKVLDQHGAYSNSIFSGLNFSI